MRAAQVAALVAVSMGAGVWALSAASDAIAAIGTPGGIAGDAGPDRDLGTSAAGAIGRGNRAGADGDEAAGRTAIADPAFVRLDANHSGSIDRAEAQLDGTVAEHFSRADRNRDGSLGLAEFQTLGRRP